MEHARKAYDVDVGRFECGMALCSLSRELPLPLPIPPFCWASPVLGWSPSPFRGFLMLSPRLWGRGTDFLKEQYTHILCLCLSLNTNPTFGSLSDLWT